MAFLSTLLIICCALGCGAVGGAVYWHSHRKESSALRWFRLFTIHSHLWGDAPGAAIERQRFLAGLGLDEMTPDMKFFQSAISSRQARSFSNLAPHTLVGLPAQLASRVPFAAAGCDMVAIATSAPDPSRTYEPLPLTFTVPAAPTWKVGLAADGSPLCLHAVPGITIAILGSTEAIENAVRGLGWPEQLVTAPISVDSCQEPLGIWEEAWDFSRTRIVTAVTTSEHSDWIGSQERPSARRISERLLDGILADAILVYGQRSGHGLLIHRDHRQAFTPFTSRSPRHSEPPASPPPAQPVPRQLDSRPVPS